MRIEAKARLLAAPSLATPAGPRRIGADVCPPTAGDSNSGSTYLGTGEVATYFTNCIFRVRSNPGPVSR